MNLTLETADIASAKIEEIVIKHKSIQEEIRNGTKTYPLIHIKRLPKEFEGFMWKVQGKTMIAIRGENLDFQIVILNAQLPKYLYRMQAIRKFKLLGGVRGFGMQAERTEESIRLTKTVNNTESKITLNAKIIT